MQWIIPPTVILQKKTIRIESKIVTRVAEADTLPELLKTKLVTMIQQDNRYIVDDANPGTILSFSITNAYTETFEGHDERGNLYRSYRGKMEVAYQAIDVASKRALDSLNLRADIGYGQQDTTASTSWRDVFGKRERDPDPRSVNETWDRLVDMIVVQMAMRVAPVPTALEVPLPGGKLDPISSKALSGLWPEVLQDAEAFSPFPKPTDDVWRSYMMALAKEAMAYKLAIESANARMGKREEIPLEQALKEAEDSQRYLYEASQIYRQILLVKANEKVFVNGQIRVTKALNTYGILIRNLKETPRVPAGGGVSPQPVPPPPPTVNTPLENVITSCKAGLDPQQIVDYIKSSDFVSDAHASNYKIKFPDDSITISKACGASSTVLFRLMRARLQEGGTTDGAPVTTLPETKAAPATRTTTRSTQRPAVKR